VDTAAPQASSATAPIPQPRDVLDAAVDAHRRTRPNNVHPAWVDGRAAGEIYDFSVAVA
jgi:hypothetical protein